MLHMYGCQKNASELSPIILNGITLKILSPLEKLSITTFNVGGTCDDITCYGDINFFICISVTAQEAHDINTNTQTRPLLVSKLN